MIKGSEQIAAEAKKARRLRGSTLGIVGLGAIGMLFVFIHAYHRNHIPCVHLHAYMYIKVATVVIIVRETFLCRLFTSDEMISDFMLRY